MLMELYFQATLTNAGIASLNRAVARAMASASVVDRLLAVCRFDWNEIGKKDEPPEITSTEPDVE